MRLIAQVTSSITRKVAEAETPVLYLHFLFCLSGFLVRFSSCLLFNFYICFVFQFSWWFSRSLHKHRSTYSRHLGRAPETPCLSFVVWQRYVLHCAFYLLLLGFLYPKSFTINPDLHNIDVLGVLQVANVRQRWAPPPAEPWMCYTLRTEETETPPPKWRHQARPQFINGCFHPS